MPRTDAASLVVAAPRSAAYAALVDEHALVAWLPPSGMRGHFERFDPRPGGSYRLTLTYDDAGAAGAGKTTADSDVVEARFVELVPDERVVQEVDFVSDDPAFAGTMTMTWSLTDVDGGTLVEFVADDVPDGISAEDHAAGLASSLANLAAHLRG
ncbi:MAG TPA: SRPBCC domain-containing protein [Ilumatobacteraceae bacterium]|nr:SRPBCC domain-containing protein [Ilumatobacteraceae bacterium]